MPLEFKKNNLHLVLKKLASSKILTKCIIIIIIIICSLGDFYISFS